MADVLTPAQRSLCMAAVKGRDTTPELAARRLIHRLGYRYVLHLEKLPGKPDLVFPSRRKVIFVHGCFWHMHRCKHGRKAPVSNVRYWERKRTGNRARDRRNTAALKAAGWDVLVVWECWTRNLGSLSARIVGFLGH